MGQVKWRKSVPVFVPVHDGGDDGVDVRRCADAEEDDEDEGLQVEYRCLVTPCISRC